MHLSCTYYWTMEALWEKMFSIDKGTVSQISDKPPIHVCVWCVCVCVCLCVCDQESRKEFCNELVTGVHRCFTFHLLGKSKAAVWWDIKVGLRSLQWMIDTKQILNLAEDCEGTYPHTGGQWCSSHTYYNGYSVKYCTATGVKVLLPALLIIAGREIFCN